LSFHQTILRFSDGIKDKGVVAVCAGKMIRQRTLERSDFWM
jgi:hypothetical protein